MARLRWAGGAEDTLTEGAEDWGSELPVLDGLCSGDRGLGVRF